MVPSRSTTASVAALVLVLLAGCTGDDGGGSGPTATATLTSTPSPSPTPTRSPTPTAAPLAVPAYHLIDTRAGIRIAREIREVPGTDPVRAAVESMLAGPTDPDYTGPWPAGTEVLGVTRDGTTIVVDLSGEARTASVGSDGAAAMVQALVHTATDAADDEAAGVLLTIDGQPAGDLWGAVSWTEPVTRVDPLDIRLLVQIDTPAEGAQLTSPVTVSGDAAVFEANLLWHVTGPDGAEVASGFATTAAGQMFAAYSFPVELPPGTYTVVVTEDDPSGGEGGAPMTDSRTITVT